MTKKTLFFTILYNRPQMLRFSALNVVTHAHNGRYVLWDNGDDPQVEAICKQIIAENTNTSLEVIYHKSENIGLNAAAKIVDLYLADCEFLMSIDEDILFLPMNFQATLQGLLEQDAVKIGYVACNVFQDGLTNGARPPLAHYREDRIYGNYVLLGPTGGWASMTSATVYRAVGGYPTNAEKFFGLDGAYSAKLNKIGYDTAIAKDVLCYHATGSTWNDYFSYQKIYEAKWNAYNKSKG